MTRKAIAILIALVGVVAASVALWLDSAEHPPPPPATYVGASTCQACHEDAFQAWQGSDHDKAMDLATDETVLGDFNDNTFVDHTGRTSRFFRDGSAFKVETTGADDSLQTFTVEYVFGHDPLQQYLIPFPNGRYQCLTIAWDTKKKQWFDLYVGQDVPPGDWLHWTGRAQTWNTMCAECHSTNLQKGYDMETDSYKTTWSEIDVSCEACHGPASNHLTWAAQSKRKRARDTTCGLETQPKLYDSKEHVAACSNCHARRQMFQDISHASRPDENFATELLRENTYHADGQIRDEVYVYGSFIQSKMYHNGVSCKDCHDPHSLKLKHEGNALCAQCHDPAVFDTKTHHFHDDNAGAQCTNCHMPERVYMGVDWRADHSIRIPRPDLTASTGSPDACSRCHDDKPLAFSVDAFRNWFGEDKPDHFGTTLADVRKNVPDALTRLVAACQNRELPDLARATMVAELIRYDSPKARQAIEFALRDESPLVRRAAVNALAEPAPPALLVPLLRDPVAGVRTAAAAVLAPQSAQLVGAHQEAFIEAKRELILATAYTGDMPGSRHNLANLYAAVGDHEAAEAQYRAALKLDARFVPAGMNLSVMLSQQGRNEEARKLLEGIVANDQNFGEAAFSLGLLQAEMRDYPAAVESLRKATVLMPQHARAFYNLGNLESFLKHNDAAESALNTAFSLQPGNPQIVHALAQFYVQSGDIQGAKLLLGRLGHHPQIAQQLAAAIQAMEH